MSAGTSCGSAATNPAASTSISAAASVAYSGSWSANPAPSFPVMIEFDTTVRIDQTRDRVFGILADFESNLARWAKGPAAAARTVGDSGVGSRYVITARIGPAKVRSPYEVTGYDPPERFAGHGTAGPVRFHEEYSLTADGPVTILTQSIRATPWAHSASRRRPWAVSFSG